MKNLSKMTVQELTDEKSRTSSALQEANEISSSLKALLDDVIKEIQKRTKPSPEPRVSDHALFRYLERVYNLDLEKVRGEILSDKAKEALKMGATAYTYNGVKFKAKDGVIITVIK